MKHAILSWLGFCAVPIVVSYVCLMQGPLSLWVAGLISCAIGILSYHVVRGLVKFSHDAGLEKIPWVRVKEDEKLPRFDCDVLAVVSRSTREDPFGLDLFYAVLNRRRIGDDGSWEWLFGDTAPFGPAVITHWCYIKGPTDEESK